MDKDKFEERLRHAYWGLEPSDVESVANWPIIKALIVISLVAAAVGVTTILAEAYVPTWLANAALGLEAIFGVAGLLFLHFRWLGRAGAKRN